MRFWATWGADAIRLLTVPMVIAGAGIIASIWAGINIVKAKEDATMAELMSSLNKGLVTSSVVILITTYGICAWLLGDIPANIEVGGDAGRFFKCGDVNELHATLYDLVDDGETLDDLGRRARERAETLYNWDLVTDAVESFYYQVLDR